MRAGAVVVVALLGAATSCTDAYCNAMGPGYGPRTSKAFPPGWNGLAQTPFVGWRSWYAFYTRVDQAMLVDVIDALVAKNRSVAGWEGKVSLCDLGYCSVGIDEGWEGCGLGVNGTQHYSNGTPATNLALFPDMKGLVDYGHSHGLKMGWYFNGCGCIETREPARGWDVDYEGDIRQLHALGFDGVKFDGCGMLCNMTRYAELMNQTGKAYEIENCHWGACTKDDASSCPTTEWCPFNWYRTSGDSNNRLGTWYDNLQTTIKFHDRQQPVSRPGCWAYPDMLQVGRLGCSLTTQGCPAPPSLVPWTRAHFAAFAIVSSPLVLSINPTDATLAPILDVIGNKRAMAINQEWAGHPGTLVKEYPPHVAIGARWDAVECRGGQMQGGDVFVLNGTVEAGVAWCQSHAHCGGFTAAPPAAAAPAACNSTRVFELHFKDPWGAGHVAGTTGASWVVGGVRPVAGVQLWAKRLGGGRTAALFINGGLTPYSAAVSLAELNMTAPAGATATDVWTGADAGVVAGGVWRTGAVPSLDSRFVVFEPK